MLICVGVMLLLFGIAFFWVGIGQSVTGGTMTIGTGHGGPPQVVDPFSFGSLGAILILCASLVLLWCARGSLLLAPEGLIVRNLFGKVVRQVPWEDITGLKSSTVRGIQKYWVQTPNGSVYPSGYQNIESLPDELARRAPNLSAVNANEQDEDRWP